MELFQFAKSELVAVFSILNQVVQVHFIVNGATSVGVRWNGEKVWPIVDYILFLHA